MKKLSFILIILIIILCACTGAVNKSDAGTENDIVALVATKQQSVIELDLTKLLSILDPEDKELQKEQANWLEDMKLNPIDAYSLKLLQVEKISDVEYKAKLRQNYNEAGKEHQLDYYNKYKLIEGKLYDSGNYFDELRQGSIIVKYTSTNKKLAESVIDDIKQLYDENISRWELTPSRPLVIKMFNNIEELRQSIKFSMWQCAGWYEYGESVKMYIPKQFEDSERVRHIVNHEMTHLFTVEKAGSNLAYWLAEGIASYYEVEENQEAPRQLIQTMNADLLTIDELESIELEKLEDKQQINNYYNNSHLITAFLIERYGEEKILEILTELGRLPSFEGTTSENDKHYREYLAQVLPKVLGLESYEAFKQEWEREISRL